MFPLLAALPTIFSAVKSVAGLATEAKNVFKSVTGDDAPNDPDELQKAVENLPPEKQEMFVATMSKRIEAYEAETDRLRVQGGELNGETLSQFDQETRNKIGLMRMTTRPIVVRWMAHVILLPFYTTVFDMLMTVVNSLIVAFSTVDKPYSIPLLTSQFYGDNTLYETVLSNISTPAAAIVISYMTLREVGKNGSGAKNTVSNLGNSVKKLIGVFKK